MLEIIKKKQFNHFIWNFIIVLFIIKWCYEFSLTSLIVNCMEIKVYRSGRVYMYIGITSSDLLFWRVSWLNYKYTVRWTFTMNNLFTNFLLLRIYVYYPTSGFSFIMFYFVNSPACVCFPFTNHFVTVGDLSVESGPRFLREYHIYRWNSHESIG